MSVGGWIKNTVIYGLIVIIGGILGGIIAGILSGMGVMSLDMAMQSGIVFRFAGIAIVYYAYTKITG